MKHGFVFYLTAIICAIMSLFFLGFTLYLIPHILLGSDFAMPGIFVRYVQWLELHHRLSGILLFITLALPFVIAGLFFFALGKGMTNRFEKSEIGQELEAITLKKKPQQVHPAWSILLGITIILFLALIIELFMSIEMEVFSFTTTTLG